MEIVGRTIDITPDGPNVLGANGHPDTTWRRKATELEANLLVLRDGTTTAALVTFDLLYVGPVISERIRTQLRGTLPDECIWLSASHTHRAPATDPDKPALGRVDIGYLHDVADRVICTIRSMLTEAGTPVLLALGADRAHHSVNRRRPGRFRFDGRRFAWGGTIMGPNPNGPTDETVRRLDLVGREGITYAVLWHYTCHPTAAPDPLAVDADFPHAARSRLRADKGKNLPVLFFQGFCGDIKPDCSARFRDMPVRRALMGPRFRLMDPLEHRQWSDSLASVLMRIRPGTAAPTTARLYCRRLVADTELVLRGSTTRELVAQVLRIGSGTDGVTLIGMGAEPVVDYVQVLEKALGEAPDQYGSVWPVGYLDQVCGYLPTEKQLAEGGYEAGGFCANFRCDSVSPHVQANAELVLRSVLNS